MIFTTMHPRAPTSCDAIVKQDRQATQKVTMYYVLSKSGEGGFKARPAHNMSFCFCLDTWSYEPK